jgi:hypothetical protein
LKIKNLKFTVPKITSSGWIQILIAILSITGGILMAIFKSKWAYVFGLAAQPFWHLFAIRKKYWGVEILNVFYGAIHIIGFYNWFFVFK